MGVRSRAVVVATALIAAVFVSSPLHLPLNNPNEGVRVFTVKALVEQHTLVINDVVREWGYIDDKAIKDGQLFQSKAPFVSLVAAAAYAAIVVVTGPLGRIDLTRVSRFFGGVVPFAICFGITWWALRQRRPDDAGDDDSTDDDAITDLSMVALVVGSGVLASLQVFSGHALAAVAPALVIALSRLPGPVPTRRLVAVGVVLSAATCAEYPAALCLPLAWLVVRRAADQAKAAAVVVAAAAVTAVPTMVAHTAMFGAPWRTGYSFLESSDYKPLVAGGFFGIDLPDPSVLLTVLVSPEIGLFFGAPLLLLGVVGIWQRRRRGLDDRVHTAIVIVVFAAFLWFIAGFRGWRGGWSVGPRYILELVGLLSVFVVDGARVIARRIRFAVVVVLASIGVLHSGLAGAFFPHLPDILRWPIGELLLPLIARGFAPDSVPLWLGQSSSISAAVVVVVVFFAVVAVGIAHRRVAVAVVLVALPLASLEVRLAPPSAKAALEVRRITDNWRPERGNPWLADVATAPEATAYAVGRDKPLRRQTLRCDDAPRPARRDVGLCSGVITAALQHVAAHEVVVVDDVLADHIGPAGGAAVVMTFSDLAARVSKVPPCSGLINVVIGHTPMPRSLTMLKDAVPPIDLGDRFQLRRLQRSAR